MFENRFLHRVGWKALCAVLLPLCVVWGVARSFAAAGAPPAETPAVEWPHQWQGRPLRPLALSDVEQRFAQRFPGAIARLTDGEQVLVLRAVHQPTRMLHPAADCYRGLGWQVQAIQLRQDAQAQLWRCFEALRAGQRLQVCERIEDAQGRAFTDTSAWYWAAALGKSQGPWQAITVARPL